LLLASLENLAFTRFKYQEYDKTTPMLRGLLRTKESRFGTDHRSSIETMGILSFALIQSGDLEEALELLKKVAKWQKENLTPSHASTKMTKEAISALALLTDGI
jgi:hypothetical protein